MTSDPPPENPETDRPGAERRRAAVALAVIALVAVALVAIMLYVLGSGGHSGGSPSTIAGTGPAVVATGGQTAPHSSSHTSSHPAPTPTASTSTSSVVVHRTPTCPTSAPCPVPGDVGGALAAVNAYRASHGVAPVRGTVTRSAQTCAVSSGNTCPSHYFWEPVGRSGQQVVRKIAASGGKGVSFLLNKSTHVVQIGWAYVPRSHSYECAIVAKG